MSAVMSVVNPKGFLSIIPDLIWGSSSKCLCPVPAAYDVEDAETPQFNWIELTLQRPSSERKKKKKKKVKGEHDNNKKQSQ